MQRITSIIIVILLVTSVTFNAHLTANVKSDENLHHANDNITGLINCYLEIKDALVADNENLASIKGKELNAILNTISGEYGDLEKQKLWENNQLFLLHYSEQIANASNLNTQRIALKGLTLAMVEMLHIADSNEISLYLQYCSMALNDGAGWLSASEDIANPYYGSSMLTCGEILERVQ